MAPSLSFTPVFSHSRRPSRREHCTTVSTHYRLARGAGLTINHPASLTQALYAIRMLNNCSGGFGIDGREPDAERACWPDARRVPAANHSEYAALTR